MFEKEIIEELITKQTKTAYMLTIDLHRLNDLIKKYPQIRFTVVSFTPYCETAFMFLVLLDYIGD